MQLPDELQIKILGELPVQDLLKATVVCPYFTLFFSYFSYQKKINLISIFFSWFRYVTSGKSWHMMDPYGLQSMSHHFIKLYQLRIF